MTHQRIFYSALCEALKPYGHVVIFNHQIGPFTADIYVHPWWVIEVDGREHNTKAYRESDAARTCYIEALGKKVMRVTNEQVADDLEDRIAWALHAIVTPCIPRPNVIRNHSLHASLR